MRRRRHLDANSLFLLFSANRSMEKSQKARWIGLSFALFATIVAIIYPLDELPENRESMVQRGVPLAPGASATIANAQGRHMWIASDENPFAPRSWEAPSPPAEAARAVQLVELAQAAPIP